MGFRITVDDTSSLNPGDSVLLREREVERLGAECAILKYGEVLTI